MLLQLPGAKKIWLTCNLSDRDSPDDLLSIAIFSLCEASSRWVGLVLGMFHYGARSIELSNYYVDLFSAEQIRRIAEVGV